MALFNVYADFIMPVSRAEGHSLSNVREWAVDKLEFELDKAGIMSDKPIVDIPDEVGVFTQILGVEAWDRVEAEARIKAALQNAGLREIHITVERSKEQG